MNDREGRLEVCNNQAWGTVCDDFWDTTDAGVACVQLGYARAGMLNIMKGSCNFVLMQCLKPFIHHHILVNTKTNNYDFLR